MARSILAKNAGRASARRRTPKRVTATTERPTRGVSSSSCSSSSSRSVRTAKPRNTSPAATRSGVVGRAVPIGEPASTDRRWVVAVARASPARTGSNRHRAKSRQRAGSPGTGVDHPACRSSGGGYSSSPQVGPSQMPPVDDRRGR